ncbi:PAS domain-containing sensor histidine kinase [Mucilaginibacter jinjuensis]|uniref:histidine kinase n=1 Tax=Mucilaginibacter jinjuensis TaxID=1176721 RepID=A0ABY7TDK7_9SPHI|nr:PAS domain-containing protein [Mucilaginibacter jinjuensis]WCT13707.1 PAS domain-containing protein [Mucilaginibacter jinjuensis]
MLTNTLSDNLFLSIFEKSTNALLVKADAAFTVVAVSDAYLQMASISREEIVGHGFFEILTKLTEHFYVADALSNSFQQVIKTREIAYLQYPDHLNVFVHQSGQHYWSVTNKPVLDEDGKVAYIIHTPVNITEQITQEVAKQAQLHGDALFRKLVMQAPFAISVCSGYELVIETANKQILELWGKSEAVLGKPLAVAVPELEGQPFVQLLRNVLASGEPHYGTETPAVLMRNGVKDTFYFNFVYYPLEENNEYTGVIIIATDVTEQVQARHVIEESEKQFRNLISQSSVAMGIMRGPDMVIDLYNDALLKIWDKTGQQVTGKKLIDVFPELKDQQYPALLKQVYETGEPFEGNEVPAYIETNSGLVLLYITFSYRPLFDVGHRVWGIMVTAYDVTGQVEARHKLELAEESLRLATEATGFGTFDVDLIKGSIVYSPRLAEIFGYDNTKQFTHKDLQSHVHPEDMGTVQKAFQKALTNGGLYFYEVRNIWPDRSIHWFRTQGSLLFDDDGKPIRMVGAVVDVTSQRHIINELKRSEENLRMATQAAELGTFDWNVAEDKLEWDKRHRQLFGYSLTDTITLDRFLKGLHPDDHERVIEALDYACNKQLSEGDYDVDYRIISFNEKKLRWIRAKGKAVFDEQGNPLRLVGTVVDITDRKQDEIRKNDFIAMASHELKTPLTSLKAYIQMLLSSARKSDNQFFSASLEKADNQIEKMTKLIYGFLDLSKIESGKLQLELSNFNINDAINEAVVDVRPITQSHQIVLEPTEDLIVHADREKIMQVAVNLINNAVKYSPKGTTITLSTLDTGNWVEVAVKDQGIGINTYDLQKIFQRFYRVQDEKTRGFSGFGIGLYLSAEIMALHHGEIDVKSEAGQGSTFYFRLPKAL